MSSSMSQAVDFRRHRFWHYEDVAATAEAVIVARTC